MKPEPYRFVWGYGPSGHTVVARDANPPDWEAECLREIRSWSLDPTAQPTCVTPVGTRGQRIAWLAFRSRLVEPQGERAYVETVAAALPWAALVDPVSARWLLTRLPAFGAQGDLAAASGAATPDAEPDAAKPPARPADAKRACLGVLLGKTVALRGGNAAEICMLAHELLPPRLASETAVAWGLAPSGRPGRPGIFAWPDRLAADGVMLIKVGGVEQNAAPSGSAAEVREAALAALIDRVAAAPDPRAAWREIGIPDEGKLLDAVALGNFVVDLAAQGPRTTVASRAMAALLNQSPEAAVVAGARLVAALRQTQGPGSASAGARLLDWLGSPGTAQSRESWDVLACCCATAALEAALDGESLAPSLPPSAGRARIANSRFADLPWESLTLYWTLAARFLRLVLEEHPEAADAVLATRYQPPKDRSMLGRLFPKMGSGQTDTLGACLSRLPTQAPPDTGPAVPPGVTDWFSPEGRQRRADLLSRWTDHGLAERLSATLTAIWSSRRRHPATLVLARIVAGHKPPP